MAATSTLELESVLYNGPSVIFYFHVQIPECFTEGVSCFEPRVLQKIVDVYFEPLNNLFGSSLNGFGTLTSIITYFGNWGLYEFRNPRSSLFVKLTPSRFFILLSQLFAIESILDSSCLVVARRIPNPDIFFQVVLSNYKRIGVVSGRKHNMVVTNLEEFFITSCSDGDQLLFVVGDVFNSLLRNSLDTVLKVSKDGLKRETCLGIIVDQLRRRYNINFQHPF